MSKLIKEKDLISFLKESFYEYDVPKELADNILLDIKISKELTQMMLLNQ